MSASKKGMNGKQRLSQDEASLRQMLCILGSLMYQQLSKV